MASPKVFDTEILIHGGISPDLARAAGFSIQQLARIQKAAQTMNREYSRAAQELNKLTPPMAKFNAQVKISESLVQNLGRSLRRIGECAAGNLLARGMTGAVSMVERLGHNFLEFSKESSNIAAKRELMSKGIGNILGSQSMADDIMKRGQAQAILSPFQVTDLQATVKRFVAAGAGANQAELLTKQVGDIVAGVGGGAPEMERAALAFGKILAGGRMTGMEARELKDLGIPFQKTLQQITGLDAKGLKKAQEKGKITSDVVMEMVKRMTGIGGIFHDGMLHFSETMIGLETSVADMWHRFQSDFGDTINEFGAMFAKFLVNNGAWTKMSDWLEHLHELSHAVTSFISSLPSSGLQDKFAPVFEKFKAPFDAMNAWLQSFFTEVGDQHGTHTVLTAAGAQKILDGIQKAEEIAAQAFSIGSQIAQGFASLMGEIVSEFKATVELFSKLQADWAKKDFGAALSDIDNWGRSVFGGSSNSSSGTSGDWNDNTDFDAFRFGQQYQMYGPHMGSGTTGGSASAFTVYGPGSGDPNDRPGGKTFDRDSWRGIGHINGVPYNLQSGDTAMRYDYATKHYHIRPGQAYRSDKDGQLHTWKDTTGSSNPENEDVFKGAQIHYSPTYNISGDSESILRAIKENHQEVARHVHRAFSDQFAASAVV